MAKSLKSYQVEEGVKVRTVLVRDERLTLMTAGYVVSVTEDCLYVFTTLMELEHVSETADALKPMKADRSSLFGSSSYWGSFSLRVL